QETVYLSEVRRIEQRLGRCVGFDGKAEQAEDAPQGVAHAGVVLDQGDQVRAIARQQCRLNGRSWRHRSVGGLVDHGRLQPLRLRLHAVVAPRSNRLRARATLDWRWLNLSTRFRGWENVRQLHIRHREAGVGYRRRTPVPGWIEQGRP